MNRVNGGVRRVKRSTLTVAGVALLGLVASQGSPASTAVGSVAQGASAQALISKLAVLRRPQTSTDMLSPDLHFSRVPSGEGAIIPSLTRLVATVPGAELFIVVTTPAQGSPPLWSPKLGDQLAIVAVTPQGATESPAVPAADLTNADDVAIVGDTGNPASDVYHAAIVPDGVATVRWTFGDLAGKRTRVVDAQATNNIAVVPLVTGAGFLVGTPRWYSSDGQLVPTSESALTRAIAARYAVWSARIIRYDTHHHYNAPAALLADFAVFTITSRTGVRTASGDIISHPRLSSLPFTVLNLTEPNRGLRTDPEATRQVITRSGSEVWITPGPNTLCITVLDKPTRPGLPDSGGFEGCTANLAQAETDGAGIGSSARPGGVARLYKVVPFGKTITIRTRRGTRKTFYPPDGVYAGPNGPPQR